jgi:putative DNA primase/helicase
MGTTGNGHLGIDVDPRHGGNESLSKLIAEVGHLPRTLTTLTGGGGSHHWFTYRGVVIRSNANALGPGIDVKAEGGYLLLPPSTHISGGIYRWEDYSILPAHLPPVWEQFLLNPQKTQTREADDANGPGKKIHEGHRNNYLTSLAGSMRRRGMSADEILPSLLRVNTQRCVPPLPEKQVQKIAFGVGTRYEAGTVATPGRLPITDISNAERLVEQFKDELAYVSDRSIWCAWNGKFWAEDDAMGVHRRMQEIARSIYAEAGNEQNEELRKELARWARRSEAQKTQRESIEAARCLLEIPKFSKVFDTHPLLFNVANGTVAEDGGFRPHSRPDFLTRLSEIECRPDAECPRFHQFLSETFRGNQELIEYVTHLAGYFMTGSTTEQAWWMLCGPTASGKSTFVRILHGILGPYALSLPENYFLLSRSSNRDFTTANIAGTRLCTCVETAEGRRLNVARIKVLTGEDEISAERKYQDLFQFRPQCKLVLVTNHAPHVPASDDALWRRLKVVPFLATVPVGNRIPGFAEQLLKNEASGILNWALRGRRAWQSGGLKEPSEVTAAVTQYRRAEDFVGDFISDCCSLVSMGRVSKKEMVAAFTDYAKENMGHPCSTKKLTMELARFGVNVSADERHYMGIRLADTVKV